MLLVAREEYGREGAVAIDGEGVAEYLVDVG